MIAINMSVVICQVPIQFVHLEKGLIRAIVFNNNIAQLSDSSKLTITLIYRPAQLTIKFHTLTAVPIDFCGLSILKSNKCKQSNQCTFKRSFLADISFTNLCWTYNGFNICLSNY